ncbi:tetratricopeptide repeat protein [Georgenia sunbinii]|uniref:tetratricopeptide repeat protein n=1 Tax=Georgenia sunbinii TaxID=3117728 RepID=UPI002F26210D
MTSPYDAVDWTMPPMGLDTISADLRSLRAAAGDPSYTEIGRRIAERRAARGVPEHERRMPRSTLYDCFRDGRRRMSSDTVTEIALALGLPAELRPRWAARLRLARSAQDSAAVAAVRDDVPSPVPYFAGRVDELSALTEIAARSGAGWISGMAGAGKTQLALRLAERLAVDTAHAMFLDLRGQHAESPPVAATAAQRAILRRLDVEDTDDGADRRTRMLQALRGSGRVLVLDDAAGPGQVAAILGDAPAIPVVVTSRAPAPTGWTHVPLRGLSEPEIAELLATVSPEGAAPTDRDATRLVQVTGGLPLAIALLSGRLSSHPDWTLEEHIDLLAQRLASARVDDELRAELDLSYADLPAPAARLLRAFADLPVAELDPGAAAALLESTPERATEVISELADASLAVRRGSGRIALHSLVRAYARERAEDTEPPRVRAASFARIGQFLATRVWSAYATIARAMEDTPRRTTFSYPDLEWPSDEADAWLRAQLPSLLALAHAAPDRGHPQLLFRFSEGLSWWLNLTGHLPDALRLHEAAADLAAEVGDADALAMASLDAGQLLVSSADPDAAQEHFTRATRLVADAGQLSDPGLAGVIANMSAVIDYRRGRIPEACASLRRAIAVHEDRAEHVRLMSALVNLGVALHTVGDFAAEREAIERALTIARTHGHGLFEANALVNRAELHLETGTTEQTVTDADDGVRLAHRLGVPFLVASGEATAAEALRRRGDLDDAAERIERAMAAARQTGSGITMSGVLLAAAAVAADRRQPDVAHTHLDEAEPMLAEDGDHVLRGRLWQLRAELSTGLESERHLAEARRHFARTGSFHAVAVA